MRRTINSTKLTLLVCLLVLLSLSLSAASVLAQEPEPRPPLPGENGNGGNNGSGDQGNGNDTTLIRTGRVSGYVYSYSDHAYVNNVKVIIDGGGWQAETLTNSQGFYEFTGLGAGRALLNLQLPPGAHPVVFDWPVQVGNGADVRVDLGYYWQDPSVLPALITGQVTDQVLRLAVKNQTSAKLNGSTLVINSPVDLQISPAITAGQGKVADYGPYQARFAMGDIEPAANITVDTPLEKISNLSAQPDEAHIRVIFTYDQQKTPLLVNIQPGQIEPASASPSQTAATAPPLPSSPAVAPPPAPAPTRSASPLPMTGNVLASTSPVELILPLLLLFSVCFAGWRSLKTMLGREKNL